MATKKVTRAGRKTTATEADFASIDFKAAVTHEQLEHYENRCSGSGDIAVARRATMAALTRSKTELVNGFGEDEDGRQSLCAVIDVAHDYINQLKSDLRLAEAAHARLLSVGATIASNVGETLGFGV